MPPEPATFERDTSAARWWLRWPARRLAAREARVLEALARLPGIPRLVAWDGRRLRRQWLAGFTLSEASPRDRRYFREALRLVRRMHAAGVVHNGLARTSRWLVTPEGGPALVGFDSALRPRYRSRWFRALAYEDLRELLVHKREHCAGALTARERAILARPTSIARLLRRGQGSIVSNSRVGASPGRK